MARISSISALLSLLAVLGGCASQSERVAPAAAVPPPAATPQPIRDNITPSDGKPTPGHWRYTADQHGSIARFVAPGTGAIELMIRCAMPEKAVIIHRRGLAARFVIVTSFGSQTMTTDATAWPVPGFSAALLPGDDLFLDKMAFSRATLTIAADPLLQLIVPQWPDVARAIEDCRK